MRKMSLSSSQTPSPRRQRLSRRTALKRSLTPSQKSTIRLSLNSRRSLKRLWRLLRRARRQTMILHHRSNVIERFISRLGGKWSVVLYNAKVQVMNEDRGYIWDRKARKNFLKRNPTALSIEWSRRVLNRPCMTRWNEWYTRWLAVCYTGWYSFLKSWALNPHKAIWGPPFWYEEG